MHIPRGTTPAFGRIRAPSTKKDPKGSFLFYHVILKVSELHQTHP